MVTETNYYNFGNSPTNLPTGERGGDIHDREGDEVFGDDNDESNMMILIIMAMMMMRMVTGLLVLAAMH